MTVDRWDLRHPDEGGPGHQMALAVIRSSRPSKLVAVSLPDADIGGHRGNRAMPKLPRMPPTQTSSSTSMATVPSRKNSLPM